MEPQFPAIREKPCLEEEAVPLRSQILVQNHRRSAPFTEHREGVLFAQECQGSLRTCTQNEHIPSFRPVPGPAREPGIPVVPKTNTLEKFILGHHLYFLAALSEDLLCEVLVATPCRWTSSDLLCWESSHVRVVFHFSKIL